MDDLEDLQASEFVTDTEDQDSLDERIDSEQRLRNHQLWTSFQNAASCLTELYKDRAQPNISPWVPFQNAASNLTTLYKDCIESQKRFAKIGYQVGRRRRMRELTKLLKKHKIPMKHLQALNANQDLGETYASSPTNTTTTTTTAATTTLLSPTIASTHNTSSSIINVDQSNHFVASVADAQSPTSLSSSASASASGAGISFSSAAATAAAVSASAASTTDAMGQQHNNVASILAVNQLNLGCDDSPSPNYMQAQPSSQIHLQQPLTSPQISLGNGEDDLLTFQQALAQPTTIRGIKSSQNRRPCSNSQGYFNSNRPIDSKTEEERLLELNQFLSEEYHRHVGSRKRSCSTLGGSPIKRLRD